MTRASDDQAVRDLAYAIAQQVHDLRHEKGVSQSDLASRAGTRQPHVSRLEAARSLPSLELLVRIAEGLDATITVTLTPRSAQPRSAATSPREVTA
ncbi:helix-turn-helix domain-containing protein [Streptomyces marianii]|nr:helix-turn-helix transcriptional regulator [Streptomyces marianii]